MPFEEKLAGRVRALLETRSDVEENRMFGGLAFMVGGQVACGIVGDQLMVRVGPETNQETLRRPHAEEMRFTGKPVRGFVMAAPAGVTSLRAVGSWVRRGIEFTSTLPPKK